MGKRRASWALVVTEVQGCWLQVAIDDRWSLVVGRLVEPEEGPPLVGAVAIRVVISCRCRYG